MGKPDTWQQEQFSLAYLSAVATHAGVTIAHWNVDKDGVDATIKRKGISVDLQMKCTFVPTVVQGGDAYAFDLDMRTYNLLRDRERTSAGFLALVVVPPDLDSWLAHQEQALLMNCAGYYARIQDLPAVTNEATTRILLPKKQRIDQAGVDDIFNYAFNRLFGPGAREGVQ
ncbi:DUF4365 domain-containing protein [Streptomyces sp. NPDC058583]|uniref:DUF4365 domain-containing protein n=1 Tax=unclassified Streptomyces TaxID=2593676 RepID=UPI00364B4099